MSEDTKPSLRQGKQWQFRKEIVLLLRSKLIEAFKAAGMGALVNPPDEVETKQLTFYEDDDVIKDLAMQTKELLILEKCPDENDNELKSLLDAELQTFLNPVLNINQQNLEKVIQIMQEIVEKYSAKYKRNLNDFMRITKVSMTDEYLLQSFHNETALKLLQEFDGLDKPGNEGFQGRFREQIQRSFSEMYASAFHDYKKEVDKVNKKIQEFIEHENREHLKRLIEEAAKIEDSNQLAVIHQQLTATSIQKLKIEMAFVGSMQYNFAELKLTEELARTYHQCFLKISTAKKTIKKKCQHEFDICVQLYKSKMEEILNIKKIAEEKDDLVLEHEEAINSVFTQFDNGVTINEEGAFVTPIKEHYKEKLKKNLERERSSFEKSWEIKQKFCHIEIKEFFCSFRHQLEEKIIGVITTANTFEELVSVAEEAAVKGKASFYEKFSNLWEHHQQTCMQQLTVTTCGVLSTQTENFMNLTRRKYMKIIKQSLSQNPFAEEQDLKNLHDSITANTVKTQSIGKMPAGLLHILQDYHSKITSLLEECYQILLLEQKNKIEPRLKEAEAVAANLSQVHFENTFEKLSDKVSSDQLEQFAKQNRQELAEKYKETISWAVKGGTRHKYLMELLSKHLKTRYIEATAAINLLENVYDENIKRNEHTSDSKLFLPAIPLECHKQACLAAVSKCIEDKLLQDSIKLQTDANLFLERKYKQRLADTTVIGIDFGTNYCRSAVHVDGKIVTIPHYDATGKMFSSLACYVGVGELDGTMGKDAQKIVEEFSELRPIIYDPKIIYWWNIYDNNCDSRDYCAWWNGEKPPAISFGDQKYSVESVACKLFQKIKENAESFLKYSVGKCVITFDHQFDRNSKTRIEEAGKLAGFSSVILLEEYNSAALSYQYIHGLWDNVRIILLIDLGTIFRFYVLELSKEIKLLGYSQDYGGHFITFCLVNYCIKEFCKMENVVQTEFNSDPSIKIMKRRAYIACQKATISLSTSNVTTVKITNFSRGKQLCIDVTRVMFEKTWKYYLSSDTEDYLNSVFSSAKISKENIDGVVITGACSQIPKIKETLNTYFNGRPWNTLNLDAEQMMAHGAAVKGALLAAEEMGKLGTKSN